ncbi:Gluconolactonase [Acetobacteraceae bacterium EV16G]|uniref:Gluconolactonase n=2 Tax=Sorlinia euscelidii TaxID=3081148 RepID=A0ABU7U2Y5_9PROT
MMFERTRLDQVESTSQRTASVENRLSLSRRTVLLGGLAGLASADSARAVARRMLVAPPSVISNPPRLWGPGAPYAFTPDPDILTLDPAFNDVLYGNAGLELAWRATQHHPARWLEGPAWCTEGRFLLLSDVVGGVQYRYAHDAHNMTVFRKESYHSNGNSFDREGRLLTCEHGLRRVIRWEHDGSCTVIAKEYQGGELNSPNDIVVAPDGGIWFTDPPYGDRLLEGHPDAPEGHGATASRLKWNLDAEVMTEIGGRAHREAHVFHVDPHTLEITAVLSASELAGPNGLCFSPDGRVLYIASSEIDTSRAGGGHYNLYAFDVEGKTLRNKRIFTHTNVAQHKLMPDGIKADVSGNIWVGVSGPLGFGGVLVYDPSGKLIGRLRLPRSVSNLTFGGTQRNCLFMCAKDAIFTLDVATQGAGYA